MKTKPFKHQEIAIKKLNDLSINALFSDPGTGKSRIILEKIYNDDYKRIAIICPNYLKDNWKEQIELHFPDPVEVIIWKGMLSQKELNQFNRLISCKNKIIFIINVEAFQSLKIEKYYKVFNPESVIIDESVTIKNPAAMRTKKIIELSKKAKHKAILSGTPVTQSPVDLWSQFDFLRSGFWKQSFFQFRHNHVLLVSDNIRGQKFFRTLEEVDYNRVKKLAGNDDLTIQRVSEIALKTGLSDRNVISILAMKQFTPYRDLDKIESMIEPFTFKIKKEDCLDLPPKVYEKLYCDLSITQKKLMRELKYDRYAEIDSSGLSIQNAVSLAIRLRMITSGLFPCNDLLTFDIDDLDFSSKTVVKRLPENPKLKILLEDIQTLPDNEPVIVWSNFVESIKWITELLSDYYPTAAYFGGVSEKDRKERIDDFKSGKIKILVMNPATGGMGLNLQNCRMQYFFDNSYRSDIRIQCEDRCHRAGQTGTVIYKDIIAHGSFDEEILEILAGKISLIEYFKTRKVK